MIWKVEYLESSQIEKLVFEREVQCSFNLTHIQNLTLNSNLLLGNTENNILVVWDLDKTKDNLIAQVQGQPDSAFAETVILEKDQDDFLLVTVCQNLKKVLQINQTPNLYEAQKEQYSITEEFPPSLKTPSPKIEGQHSIQILPYSSATESGFKIVHLLKESNHIVFWSLQPKSDWKFSIYEFYFITLPSLYIFLTPYVDKTYSFP